MTQTHGICSLDISQSAERHGKISDHVLFVHFVASQTIRLTEAGGDDTTRGISHHDALHDSLIMKHEQVKHITLVMKHEQVKHMAPCLNIEHWCNCHCNGNCNLAFI